MSRRSLLLAAAAFRGASGGGGGGGAATALSFANTSPVFETDYLRLAAALNINADFTACGWFRVPDLTVDVTCLFLGDAGAQNIDYLMVRATGRLSLGSKAADAQTLDYNTVGGALFPAATWAHLALVRSAGTLGVYLNATLIDGFQASSVAGRAAATEMVLGAWAGGASAKPFAAFGWKFFTAALTQAQIAAEKDKAAPVLATSRWAAYTFENDTTGLVDSTGQRADFTANGDEITTIAGPAGVT